MLRFALAVVLFGTSACHFAHTTAAPPAAYRAAPSAQPELGMAHEAPTSLVFGYGPGWQMAREREQRLGRPQAQGNAAAVQARPRR